MFNKIDLDYNGSAWDSASSRLVAGLSVAGLLFFLVFMLLKHDVHNTGIRLYVDDNIDLSGVSNPVTAVLLNFRAYDTLLELAVLLIVVIATLPGHNQQGPLVKRMVQGEHNLVILALQRGIAPSVLMFAGYLLWAGASQPGGAFQAGALLAGTCVLMLQTGTYRINYTSIMARQLLALGLVFFVAVGLALIFFEGNLLNYPADHGGLLILLIEGCATVSIAVTLSSLYSNLVDPSFSDPTDTYRQGS